MMTAELRSIEYRRDFALVVVRFSHPEEMAGGEVCNGAQVEVFLPTEKGQTVDGLIEAALAKATDLLGGFRDFSTGLKVDDILYKETEFPDGE